MATVLRQARLEAGLTQDQLARRLGVSQAAIAQLESARANPTLATLERAVRAAGRQLELRVVPAEPQVDVSLLRDALQMSPAERIAAAERLVADAEAIAAAAARSRAKSARGRR